MITRYSCALLMLLSIAVCLSCNDNRKEPTNNEPATSSIVRIVCHTDTTGIKNEIVGLINVVGQMQHREKSDFQAVLADSIYTLKVSPKFDEQELYDLKAILNAVLRDTISFLTPPQLKIRITESEPEVLKHLNLRQGQEFLISLNHSKIRIVKTEQDLDAGYPGSSVRLNSMIYLPAIAPLPNTKYSLGVSGEESELTKAFTASIAALGYLDAGYKIVAENKILQKSADSLLLNRRVIIDSAGVSVEIANFYFGLTKPYMPTFDDDSLYKTTIQKLSSLEFYYYQLLLTPTLCVKMKGFEIL